MLKHLRPLARLDKLEAFASFYGADFYGLPRNTEP
jgi:dihydroorotase